MFLPKSLTNVTPLSLHAKWHVIPLCLPMCRVSEVLNTTLNLRKRFMIIFNISNYRILFSKSFLVQIKLFCISKYTKLVTITGDQILFWNGKSLIDSSFEESREIMCQSTDFVQLLVVQFPERYGYLFKRCLASTCYSSFHHQNLHNDLKCAGVGENVIESICRRIFTI